MKKTQGQKRKRIVRIIALAFFLITTGFGVILTQNIVIDAFSSVDNTEQAQATVTNLNNDIEQYSGFQNKRQMDKTSEKQDSAVTITSVVAVNSVIALSINFLLGIIFVRESRSKLNEGFYSEDSWLDVTDNKLVLLNDNCIAIADLKNRQIKSVTKAYQHGASHKELISLIKADQIKTMVLANITALHSRHDEDLILLADREKELNLSFLNMGTKAHALQRLEARLPDTLVKTKIKRSRLRAASPRLAMLILLVAFGVNFDHAGAWCAIGFLSVLFILPNLIVRLISPSVVTTYKSISAVSALGYDKSNKLLLGVPSC